LAPFAPFLSEEVWVGVLDKKFSVHTSSWPQFEPELVKEDTVTFIVQINGKLRATLEIKEQRSRNKDQVVKAVKAEENVRKWLKGKKLKTTIFIPGKLVNFVI
jgi:leucyl-tRNA synthetase